MPRSRSKLDDLADMLARTGDDPERLDVVQRAQRFKRSWVDLAESLVRLRKSRAYETWGYADLHEYCNKELAIRGATVDKLLLSFTTVERHAPEVLARDGVARDIPSIEAVDFFTRALGSDDKPGPFRRLDAPDDVVEQLRSAVFDEGQGVRELRERFNPVLHPKNDNDETRDVVRKAQAAARRLIDMLSEIEGLTEARVGRTIAALEAVLRDLDGLLTASAAKTARTANKTLRARKTRN
jgi:hypothetical protein